ncbi:YeiH family putative sulfate export transporter [Oligella ureolytica]|nr:YeiH family putative sulfate export transporter [Alcaligenaceae bacterium]HZJ96223.1 YeiH family protein [Oligella sp.]
MNQTQIKQKSTLSSTASNIKSLLPGLLLIGMIVFISTILVTIGIGQRYGLSPLIYSILLGMLVGNTFFNKTIHATFDGVSFAKSKLLRLGIILYGFHLTISQVWSLGLQAIFIDACMLISTFMLTYWLGTKVLKMDKDTCILTGAGCSICGAAAIMATASISRAKTSAVTQAVTVIVLFGTLAIFIYPILFPIFTNYISESAFGVYIGSSVHEVAQVVAIGKVLGEDVADTAILAKMVRVIMLAPFLFAISFIFYGKSSKSSAISNKDSTPQRFLLPWFAVWFLGIIVLNSILPLPQSVVESILFIDNILLMMAMAALGLSTQFATFKAAGPRSFILGLMIFVWLIVAGIALQLLFA